MKKIIKDFEKKIKEATTSLEKESIRTELKNYVYGLSDEDYQIYRKDALTEMKSDAEVIEKLLETYDLMKNNMLQYS